MKANVHQTLRVAALSLVFTSAACEENVVGPEAAPATPAATSPPMTIKDNKDSNIPGDEMDLTQQVAIAVTDVAKRAGVTEDAVTVQEARTVNWGTSAVGCPREGMNYLQVIVPGVLLLLEVDGKIYRYHGEAERHPFYCPDDRAQAPAYGQGKEFM